jgi:hypothetical protein
MKDLPILFSGPMVRGIITDIKRMTRRTRGLKEINQDPSRYEFRGLTDDGTRLISTFYDRQSKIEFQVRFPYGRVGTHLWVREAWACRARGDCDTIIEYAADGATEEFGPQFFYRAKRCDEPGKFRPSIHMPREFSRITLEIIGVKIEHLQDISEKDAIAEGVGPRQVDTYHGFYRDYENEGYGQGKTFARDSFASLWRSINGPDSWDTNPWVWTISFLRIEETAGTTLPGLLTKEDRHAQIASR